MATETNQMTLRQCAQSDFRKGLKEQKTGWGIISSDRTGKGISRKDRVEKNRNK